MGVKFLKAFPNVTYFLVLYVKFQNHQGLEDCYTIVNMHVKVNKN
jgi:hypothetical protein